MILSAFNNEEIPYKEDQNRIRIMEVMRVARKCGQTHSHVTNFVQINQKRTEILFWGTIIVIFSLQKWISKIWTWKFNVSDSLIEYEILCTFNWPANHPLRMPVSGAQGLQSPIRWSLGLRDMSGFEITGVPPNSTELHPNTCALMCQCYMLQDIQYMYSTLHVLLDVPIVLLSVYWNVNVFWTKLKGTCSFLVLGVVPTSLTPIGVQNKNGSKTKKRTDQN